ncbi:MAG: hypothetical protein AAGA77_15395 [Bacteroidota bacterium]
MSVLLVLTFLCLHFSEVSVQKEMDAHNFALRQIIFDQETNLDNLISLCRFELKNDNKAIEKVEKLRGEYKSIKSSRTHRSKMKKDKSAYLVTKYNAYKEIEDQLNTIFIKVSERKRLKEIENRDVIIKNRASSYTMNEEYLLEFQYVMVRNMDLSNYELFIESNGKRDRVINFPYKLSSLPDSVYFILDGINSVTGEKVKIRDRYAITP